MLQIALYIKLEVGQTIKGDIEKIYLVCYPILEKKETSCKEIVWGHTTQNYLDRRFPMNQEDRNRLEDFRQFRREVRGSSEYLLVGLDVAKDKHHAFFGTATGKTVFRRLVFENNLEGFRKLLAQTEAMKVQGGDRRRSVVGARKVFWQLAVKRIGYSGAAVARFLGVTTS